MRDLVFPQARHGLCHVLELLPLALDLVCVPLEMVSHGIRKDVRLLNRGVAGVAFPFPGAISEDVRWWCLAVPVSLK